MGRGSPCHDAHLRALTSRRARQPSLWSSTDTACPGLPPAALSVRQDTCLPAQGGLHRAPQPPSSC